MLVYTDLSVLEYRMLEVLVLTEVVLLVVVVIKHCSRRILFVLDTVRVSQTFLSSIRVGHARFKNQRST